MQVMAKLSHLQPAPGDQYLLQALNGYRDGSRVDPVMSAQAAMIAEEDVAALAKYFASLDGLETTKVE